MLFRGMADLGFTDIICTPHIIADTHPNNPETIQNAAQFLKSEAQKLGVNLDFRIAAEYMLDDTFQHALSTKQPLLKLHKNRILVEFSYIQKPSRVENFSFDLQIAGYEPVLALGLIMPVFSYCGKITISVNACRDMMPDPQLFALGLQASFDELKAAAADKAPAANKRSAANKRPAAAKVAPKPKASAVKRKASDLV